MVVKLMHSDPNDWPTFQGNLKNVRFAEIQQTETKRTKVSINEAKTNEKFKEKSTKSTDQTETTPLKDRKNPTKPSLYRSPIRLNNF